MRKRSFRFRAKAQAAILAAGLLGAVFYTGCEIDSAESASREVGLVIAGFYTNPNGGPVVQKNTGAPITSLDLRQRGDRLEAIDNNGFIFKGTIGNVQGNIASITLTGLTTAGNEGTISGTVEVGGASTSTLGAAASATLRGTWVEPSLFSTVYATASVPVYTNGGGGGCQLSIDPSSANLNANQTQTFTAKNGTSPYSWSITSGSSGGHFTTGTSSQSVTFQRDNDTVTTTIQVTDGQGCTATATIN